MSWVNVELNKADAIAFRHWLKANGVKYEVSSAYNLIHFEVLADRETVRKANAFLEVL